MIYHATHPYIDFIGILSYYDSERQKKTIRDTLDLIHLSNHVEKLVEDEMKLKEELNAIGGNEAHTEFNSAKRRLDEYQEKKARYEGRRQGLSDQKRILKRKLNEP